MVRRCPAANICGPLPVPQTSERDECRGNCVQLTQKRTNPDRVNVAAAVHAVTRWSPCRQRRAACLKARPCQPASAAHSMAVSPRRQGCATRGAGRCHDATDAAAGLAERGEAGVAQGGCDVCWGMCGDEEVGRVTRGARQPSSAAAPGSSQSLSDGGVSEHCRSSGWKSRRAAGTSCRGTGGRLAGSDKAANVSSVPGAIAAHRARERDFSRPLVCAGEGSAPLASGFVIGRSGDVS